MTCTNSSETANSTPLQVGLNPGLSCYCETPLYSMNASDDMCTYYNYVGNFTFAGINNTTVCDNTPPYYNYYTGQTATVEQSGSYPVSISATASGASFQLYKVYIDFNDNGSFDDAGEMVYTSGFISTATNLSTGNIVIPLNAPLGTHRLRLRSTNPLNVNIDANSCSEDGYLGEVEDYDIVINAAPACSGTPAPGATLSSKALACASTTIGLSLQNAIPGIGVTYQWEASADELFTSPTSLGTASTESTTQAATTWYRCLVTCDGNTAASTPVVVYYTENCYCTTPTTGSNGCALGLYINNVTFAGINNTSGCFSPVPYTYPYYSFFPAQEANVQQMGTYAFSASAPNNGNGYYHWYGVWIDFNDNGSFDDPGELVLASNAGASTVDNQLTGNITIPITAPAGQHIMRVRTGNVQVPINSCTDNSVSGETEDYLVNITAAPACAGTPAPGNTLASSPTACGDTNIGLSLANDPL
ncbi:MAG TPA: GEVED domain-containing protein, partial [Flavobacteriales bacterium]|nr:GEVED domain-containing protein [Flavobacteriales bacterium]